MEGVASLPASPGGGDVKADCLLLPAAQTHSEGGRLSLAQGAWVLRKGGALSSPVGLPRLPAQLLNSQALLAGSPGVSRWGHLWGAMWEGLQWDRKGGRGDGKGRQWKGVPRGRGEWVMADFTPEWAGGILLTENSLDLCSHGLGSSWE